MIVFLRIDATVLQYRDAQLALDDVDGANVILIAPTSLATSYFLTQQPLTAIPVDSFSTAVQTQLADELDSPLDTFELIQIGKWHRDSPNYLPTEFTNA